MFRHGNMSVSDVAKATGLPQPTLHQLYSGTTEHPRKKTLETLANFFSVSVNQFIGLESLPDYLPKEIKNQLNLNTTPILNWDDLYHWPNDIDFSTKKEIFLDDNANHKTFAIEMPDSSMEPIFPSKCLLIFDANKEVKDRDGVLVYLHVSNQFSFKRLLMDGKCAYIKSLNPEFNDIPSIKITTKDKIIAVLQEARIKF